MTNQQLKAHCEDVIANPQDHPDWVVDMARVALASLEADCFGWVSRCGEGVTIELNGDQHIRDGMLVYTAAPVQEMKLPDEKNHYPINSESESWMIAKNLEYAGFNRAISEVKSMNGVKS